MTLLLQGLTRGPVRQGRCDWLHNCRDGALQATVRSVISGCGLDLTAFPRSSSRYVHRARINGVVAAESAVDSTKLAATGPPRVSN